MTDPNTPTQSSNNPQDLIDQALGGPNSTPTSPATEISKQETTESSGKPLSAPEPLNQESSQVVVEPSTTEVSSTPPNIDTVPTELTTPQVEPATLPELPKETKPMGEDMPLAFMGSATADSSTTTQKLASDITVEPVTTTSVPPVLTGNNVEVAKTRSNKKGLKIVGIVAGFFLLFGAVGAASYQLLTGESLIAAIYEPKFIRDSSNKVIRNPNFDPNKIVQDDNGNMVRQEDLRNKELGIKQEPTKDVSGLSKGACESSGSGGQWCESVDSRGKPYAFCMANDGSQGNCNNRAVELGYTVQIGKVQCECKDSKIGSSGCQNWGVSTETLSAINGADVSVDTYNKNLLEATRQCQNGGNFAGAGTESYICKEGVKGGTEVYTGGPCTAANGKKFTGNLGCFCGTVQVDTPNGHTSYSSTCGCDKEVKESSPPTITTNPTLMCTSLTRTPTTTPVVGDKITFTCVGASTPAGAVSLTYKFRYSLNSGAYVAMSNKTATTSELTIASCGSYKVQCQACGTINGVLTCDPNWTTATQ